MSVQRYFPMQGSNRFGTTSFPIVKSFRIDAGAQAATTATTEKFHKGDMILGFQAKVTEAFTSSDATSVVLGFTNTTMLSSSVTKGSYVVNYITGTKNADSQVLTLTADDTFDVTISATCTLTAGKVDVHVMYVPAPDGVCDSSYKEYTTT